MSTAGISLGSLPALFKRCGFTEEKTMDTLSVMVMYWRQNDPMSDITAEFIQSEMDMEPFAVATMIREGLQQLNEIANHVRQASLTGRLMHWTIHPTTIILELDDEQPDSPNTFP